MKTLLKIFLLCIIILSEVSMLKAQSITWQRIFGGPQDESSRYGIQASDGDYIILCLKIGSNGGTFLLDLDPYGNERWTKRIDLIGTGNYIQQTEDGGFIICGGNGNGLLVKTDRSGNLIWNKSFSVNNKNTGFTKVKSIDSGNFLVCGHVSFLPGKALIMKMDSLGNVIWQEILDYSGESGASDITINSDGNIYFTGAIQVNNYYKTLFAKLNSNGDFLWFNYYGTEGLGDLQAGNSIVSESNSELFISGPYQYFFSTQAHFTKIDSAGKVIFQNVIPQANYANDMCKTSSGDYAIAGGYFPLISDDILLLLLNNKGVVLSRKLFNSFGDESDYPSSIMETNDQGYFITGTTTYEPNGSSGNPNLYIIKTDSNFNVPVFIKSISSEIPNSFKLYQNYPNPFNPNTKIKFDIFESGIVKIEVYDNSGKKISNLLNERKIKGIYEIDFDGSNLSSGIYYYKLISQHYSSTKKMLLLK